MLDLLFLFALGLLGACRSVSATSLAHPRRALLTYLLGGAQQTRAREQGLGDLVTALRALKDQGIAVPAEVLENVTVEPPNLRRAAEVVTRLLRRPRDAQRILRYIEWWGQAQVGLGSGDVVDVLGPIYGDYTRKLVSDIGRMSFRAAQLDSNWIQLASRSRNR